MDPWPSGSAVLPAATSEKHLLRTGLSTLSRHTKLPPTTLGEVRRFLHFYQGLQMPERRHLNRVTEELPYDRNAGLANVKRKIWRKFWTLFGFTALIGRMLLNLYSVASMQTLTRRTTRLPGDHVVIHQNFTQICDPSLSGTSSGCISLGLSRLQELRLLCLIELVVVASTIAVLLVFALLFLVCDCTFATSLPVRYPYVFFFLPRLAGTYSNMSFLGFANVQRFKSLFRSGELLLGATLVADSFCCWNAPALLEDLDEGDASDLEISDEDWERMSEPAEEGCQSRFSVRQAFEVIIYGSLLLFSIQALLLKLTTVYFAVLRSWEAWTLGEWLLLLGFVNQLAGTSDLHWIEVHRVLLFRFGGVNVKWRAGECQACTSYFRFLALKIVEGKIGQESSRWRLAGRARALAAMATFSAWGLQRLLLDHRREVGLIRSRSRRFRLREELFAGQKAASLLEALLEMRHASPSTPASVDLGQMRDWRHWMQGLKQKRDQLLAGDAAELNFADLLLVAEVQEHIDFQPLHMDGATQQRYRRLLRTGTLSEYTVGETGPDKATSGASRFSFFVEPVGAGRDLECSAEEKASKA